jgi:DNA-binding transcriptional MerR regulator
MPERVYRIHVVAQRTGLSEGLIRAWERRYGVVEPRRTPGGYRVYQDSDIELLKRLKKLTEEGVSIREAVGLLPDLRRELENGAAMAPAPEGGAQVERWIAEISSAAEHYDQRHVEAVLDEALASLPPLTALSALLMPALRAVGDRWHSGSLPVVSEHLVSQAIRSRLIGLVHGAPRGSRGHAVCACFPDEDHELGLLSAALRLRHSGYRVTYLGARTPAIDLGKLAHAVRPDLVALAAVNASGAREFKMSLARIVKALPHGLKVWVGGAAAVAHLDVCRALKVEVIGDDASFVRALS